MWTKKGYHVGKKITYVNNTRSYVDKKSCFFCKCGTSIFSMKSISYDSNDFLSRVAFTDIVLYTGDGSA